MNQITKFSEYQAIAMTTGDMYPRITRQQPGTIGASETLPVYPALAALGELAELLAKVQGFDRNSLPRAAFANEIGDVLWYVTAAAVELGFSLRRLAIGDDDIAIWTHYHCSALERRGVRRHISALVIVLGRFSERVKKAWRDGTPLDREECVRDLRQALHLLQAIAGCFYTDLVEVANLNATKVTSRRQRGTLAGAGDDR